MFFQDAEDKGMHEINVVPLIDVSLVLVVILMLLTPLAFESNIAVHRTQAAPTESVSCSVFHPGTHCWRAW